MLQIREHVPLAPLTTIGIAGPARYFVRATTVDEIARAVEKDGYKFSRLIVEVVKSYPFLHRRNREAGDE